MTETIEVYEFNMKFTFTCPKCDYKNEDISAVDIANGNAECGMCETLFKIEGIDTIKIFALLE
jgi:transcription elongation factor Elf1